jgi:hypothetical protein
MFSKSLGVLFGIALAVSLLTCSAQAQIAASFAFPQNVPVGSASAAQTVTLTVQSAGTVGSIEVLTAGAAGLDYAASGAGSCAVGAAYPAGNICTVSVALTPKYPGIRTGAVVLLDANGNPMATELLSGIGTGPLSVATAGEIATVAGNGQLANASLPVSGSLAVNSAIQLPLSVAVDGAGNVYYTDSGNNLIVKVDGNGNLTIIAGTGHSGFSPNGTVATSALLNTPSAILLDGAGNIFFTESGNSTVREIVAATGLIETIAGTGVTGYTGDGSAASAATLSHPSGLAIDASGNLYISDTGNHAIREISAVTGNIATIAGGSGPGFTGDGGPALAAQFNQPWGIAFGTDGSLYVADFINDRVRKISPSGTITTVAGSGDNSGYSGDAGAATAALLDHPAGIAVDAAGNLYISDSDNNVVRRVNATSGIITTLAGNGQAVSDGDGVNADSATPAMNKTYGLCLDGSGNLYIADRLGLKIREVYSATARIQFKDIKVTNTSPPTIQRIDNDGNAPLHLSAITPVSNAAVDPATTTCSTTVAMAVGAECNVGAEFKPEVVGSPVSGQINVVSDSPNTPVMIDLFGNSLTIEPTTVALTSSLNPSAAGQTVTFTATISSLYTGSLTGTVQFVDQSNGNAVIGGVPQIVNSTTRKATVNTSTLALGSHQIVAVFTDSDGNNASGNSPTLTQVVKQTAALALSSSLNPAHVYDNVTFTVAASESPSGGVAPTGSVVFTDSVLGPLPGGSVALSNGSASYSTALLAAGSHNITATYAGDANNLPATSNMVVEVIQAAPTTTSLVTSYASVLPTAPVAFTANVTGSSTSTPTGNVIFKDGATTLGTVAVSNSGVAVFQTTTLSTGTHSITAAYQGDADYASSVSPAVTETVNKIATSVAVSPSANPATAGAAVVFAVTVTAANSTSPNIAITGQVTLMDGATAIGSATLAALGSGPATATVNISLSTLSTGSHAITAVYNGDANYLTATSGAVSESITLATSSNVLTASPASVIVTKPLTLTATLTSNGGTPTGTVTFVDSGTAIGTGTLANGIASLADSSLAVGTHTITAVYGGDAKNSGSTSNAVTVTVQAATTKVALTPSQSPTNFGQPFTLTATVTGNGGVPTGSVTFSDGGNALATVGLTNGVATYTTSTLTDGSHIFTASYAGDTNDLPAISSPLTVQVLESLSLTVTSTSPNPSVARSNVHFVATITANQGIQPTGSITFKDGATVLGTGAITGTTATFDTALLAVGTHSIVAVYGGDANTQSLASAPYSQVVNAAGVTVSLASSANPATFGTPLTLTATASSPAGALTGTVKFEDSGTTIGSATLSSTGSAVFTTSALSAGSHNIVAAYQGDANDQPASSTTLVQVVERATTVALTSSQNPLATLASVTITATVANGGTAAATGTVSFSQDGAVVSTAPVSASGTATLQVASLPVGTHSFIASYSGDAIDLPSTSAQLSEVVQLRPTTDALTSSASSLTGGQQLTLISVVKWTGATTPTGTVTFFNGTNSLATAQLDSTGVATVTVLLSGTSASISSAYAGDANYAASTSATALVTIGPAQNFTMAADPGNFTLVSKQHEIVTVTIGSVKDFTDTLSMGCLGLPQAASCSFSKDQILLGAGTTQTVTLTVDTGDPLLAGSQARNDAPVGRPGTGEKLALACLLPGGLLLGLLGMRSRRLRGFGGLLLFVVLAGLSTAMIGCGTVNEMGTPAGSYTFSVSATGKTGITQTLPMTMTVTASASASQ